PHRQPTVPQQIVAQVAVRNLGRDAATSSVAVYDADASTPPRASQDITLGARSQATLLLPFTVDRAGSRPIVVVADPDGTLAETDESNNQASATLTDPAKTLDIQLVPASVTPSPSCLVVGSDLTVPALVRNRGTARILGVPVILAHVTPNGLAELARADATLAPGESRSLSFTWRTALTGDPLPLAVAADPF